MIRKVLQIGRWIVTFVFFPEGYDMNYVLDYLYYLDASDEDLVSAYDKMLAEGPNEGVTFANPEMKEALIVIGPTTSGKQFLNSISHEIDHLSDEIASWYGVKGHREGTSYRTGDTTMALAELICRFGCDHCRE